MMKHDRYLKNYNGYRTETWSTIVPYFSASCDEKGMNKYYCKMVWLMYLSNREAKRNMDSVDYTEEIGIGHTHYHHKHHHFHFFVRHTFASLFCVFQAFRLHQLGTYHVWMNSNTSCMFDLRCHHVIIFP